MIKVNDYFEKVFYINLDHRIDRLEQTKKQLAKFNIIAERISGIKCHKKIGRAHV